MPTGYFAKVTEGVVTDVRRTTKEYIDLNKDLYTGTWVEVDNMSNYPSIGFLFDDKLGFIKPKPFPSWIWSTEGNEWVSPVAMPSDGAFYIWDEASTDWVKV